MGVEEEWVLWRERAVQPLMKWALQPATRQQRWSWEARRPRSAPCEWWALPIQHQALAQQVLEAVWEAELLRGLERGAPQQVQEVASVFPAAFSVSADVGR